MDLKKKLYKIVTEDFPFKIMIIFLNGSLKMKKSITSKKLPSQRNNSIKKKKDLWLLTQEFQRK